MYGDSGENSHLFSSSCFPHSCFLPAGFGPVLCDNGVPQTHSREQKETGQDRSQWNGQPRISENVGGCKNAKGTVLETGKNCDRVLQSQSTHWLTCCLW